MTPLPAWPIWDADAIVCLAYLVLALVIVGALLLGKHKTRPTWWLVGCLSGMLGQFGIMLALSTLPLVEWVPLQFPAILLGVGCFIQFTYCFPRALPQQATRARLALVLSAGAFLLGLGLALAWFGSLVSLGVARLVGLGLSIVQFTWATINLVIRTVYFNEQHLTAPGLPGPAKGLGRAWAALARPAGREAQATRAFALVVFSPMLMLAWSLLYYTAVLPGELYLIVLDLSTLAFVFVFVMVYLNYAAEPITFTIKLTLSTLVITISAISLLSQVMLSPYKASYDRARQAEVQQVKSALAQADQPGSLDAADWPAPLAFVISRPSPGAPYTLHFARDDRVDVQYINNRGLGLLSVPISQAGPGRDSLYYHYSFEQAGQEYVVGFPLAMYRDALTPYSLPAVYVLLGSSALILLIVPAFFRASIVRPLDSLLEGVRRVNAGHKDVSVPIQHNDEIGFLTEAFNRMVVSVRRAEELQVLRQEMSVAHKIQLSLLPQAAPTIPGLDIAATSLPAREVGGDLYTYYALPGGSYGLAIGDVTGKGIPAALYMAVSTTMLEAKAPHILDVAQLLSEMNVALFPHMRSNRMNTALCCMRLEPGSAGGYTLHVANAGMVAPILRRGTQCEYLDVGGLPVGTTRAAVPYSALQLALRPGDLLVLSSDGIVEAMNAAGELYGFERLLARVRSAPGHSAQELQDWLLSDVRAFAGQAEQHDDMTLIVVLVQEQ